MGKEILDVGAKGVNRARRDKAEDIHVAIHAIPQFPGYPAHVSGTLLGANWADTSVPSEPNQSTVRSRFHGRKTTHQIISS